MGKLLDITTAVTKCKEQRHDDHETVLLDAYYREQPKKK